MSATTDEVLDLEKGFWTNAHDPSYFERHLASEALTVIEPMGFVDKPQAVRMTADAPWTNVRFTDVEVREIGPDCVILAYHGTGRHGGDQKPYRGSIVSTYIRRDGRWQLALSAHQPWTSDTTTPL